MREGNEKGERVYRKLCYYYENKIPVHFKVEKDDSFSNGIILDLSKEKLTLVLKEFVVGEMPYLLEEIKEDSISTYIDLKNKVGGNDD